MPQDDIFNAPIKGKLRKLFKVILVRSQKIVVVVKEQHKKRPHCITVHSGHDTGRDIEDVGYSHMKVIDIHLRKIFIAKSKNLDGSYITKPNSNLHYGIHHFIEFICQCMTNCSAPCKCCMQM